MKKTNNLNLIIAVLAFFFFGIVAYLTNYVGIFNNFDQNAVEFLHNIAVKHSLTIPNIITDFGFVYVISSFLIIVSLILAYYGKYKEALMLNLSPNIALMASSIFKEIFKRTRPPLEYHLTYSAGYSFPSGHAVIAVCFYGISIYLLMKLIKNTLLKYTIATLLTFLIFLVGVSRIYLGVHFPTDVVAAVFLGLSFIFALIYLYNLKK